VKSGWLTLRDDWSWHTVRDLQDQGVLLVEDGNHGEYRPRPDEFTEQGTSFLRAADLSDGRPLFASAGRINETALRRIRKGIGRPGDVLFSHKGTVGKLAVAPDDSPPYVCSPQTTFWRVTDPKRLDRYFLFAYMRAPEFIRQWTVRKGDTDMADYVSLTAQRTLLVPLPPLPTQRKIATILSAYDDLIQNNKSRIKLLEEMAQRIYREWFVDFRYPGHEDVPLVDSELGPIPEGWKPTTLGEWASVVVGSTPSRKVQAYWSDGDVPWINSSQINDLCVIKATEMITQDAFRSTSTKMMPVGTTLVAITGATLGQVSYLAIDACGSQNVCGIFVPDSTEAPYLYYAISNAIGSIANRAMGGAQQHINRRIVQEAFAIKPTRAVLSAFGNVAQIFLDRIVSLLRCQEALRATRDLLLPRLISGEVDVSDLDIAMPEDAA
jgi:type I restriction enzyme S subunit